MKFDRVRAGDVLYQTSRGPLGNTTMSTESLYEVLVVEVNHEARTAVIRWNGNAARQVNERAFARLRPHPPEWIKRAYAAGGHYCAVCGARRADGHKQDCQHPRAVSARRKAAKEQAL